MRKYLMILAIFVVDFQAVKSQDLSKDTMEMTPVKIQENRLTIYSYAPSYSIINYKKQSNMPNMSVADILALESSVDVRQRGPAGVQADVAIRGGSFDQTLLMWNGLKLSDPQTGHHLMNLPFPDEAIDKIIVSKNAAAKNYGLNAYSGYINILTKVPSKNSVYAGVKMGDFGFYQYQLGGVVNKKYKSFNWGQHLSAQMSESNGYAENTDFKNQALYYQSDLKWKKASLNIMGAYSERAFGARGFYVVNSSEYEVVKTGFVGAIHQVQKNNWNFKSQVYWRNNDDKYIYLRAKPEIYTNRHYTNTSGAEFHVVNENILGETGFGLDFRHEAISSYNYSGGIRKTQLGSHSRDIFGLFVEHKIQSKDKKIIVLPGMYLNSVNNQFQIFPGIDLKYNLKSNLILFASSNSAMRLPTYTDFYYTSANNIGNENLMAESIVHSELGGQYSVKQHRFGLALFNKNSNNTIDWARAADTLAWQPQNINQLQTNGIELNYKYIGRNWLEMFGVDYTYLDMQLVKTDDLLSRYALTNLKHQLIIKMQVKLPKNFQLTGSFRHLERVQLVDYQILNLKLNWKYKNLNAFADVNNVLDADYFEAGYVQMPGRWFCMGVKVRIEEK